MVFLFFGVWTYWTGLTLFTTPWVLGTHSTLRYSVLEKTVMLPERAHNRKLVLSNDIYVPSWDSVKSYGIQLSLDVFPVYPHKDKELTYYLHQCHPLLMAVCRDAGKRDLFNINMGAVKTKQHYFEVPRVFTTEPFPGSGSSKGDVDYTRPRCTLELVTDNTGTCVQPETLANVYAVLNVYPQWHWLDWFPRIVAEPLFEWLSWATDSLFSRPLKGWR